MSEQSRANTNEKVDKVASSVKGVEGRANQEINNLRKELFKTTKGIKALEKHLRNWRTFIKSEGNWMKPLTTRAKRWIKVASKSFFSE